MYLNSYVPVYPVPTSFTTSLTLKRNIHLHETISVIEEQSKKKNGKKKKYIYSRANKIRFYGNFCWTKYKNVSAKLETEQHENECIKKMKKVGR